MEDLSQFRTVILAVDDALLNDRYDVVLALVIPFVEAGHAWAQTCIGTLYLLGTGVEQNFAKAEQYFLSAAAQDHGPAWHALAQLYSLGSLDQPADIAKSNQCLKHAQELGYYPGQPLPGIFEDPN